MFLMGTVEQTTTPQSTISQLPETRLDLSLRGLFVSQESELSGAVIETGDKQPSFFQIGDLISEDIVLAAIEGQAAIIERDGNLKPILVLWGGKS
jgi:type II secretory pathway component PulC